MRRAFVSSLMAGLLLVSATGTAVAQDEGSSLGDQPGAYQRVEVPTAGIAITFPSDWSIERPMETYEMALPPGVDGAAPVITTLRARGPEGPQCGMELFESNPLSLEEHVAWVEQVNREDLGFEGTIGHVTVELPATEAIRVDGDHSGDGVWTTMYMFDQGEARHLLYCLDHERAGDDYLSIAEAIELLPPRPPGVPDDAVSWAEIGQFHSELPVNEPEGMKFLGAWCDRALWLELPDGSFEERIECRLTDDLIDPPELQATRPTAQVSSSGGECEWMSDFWLNYDGSVVIAESWAVTIEPDGSATGTARYGTTLLDCPEG